MNPSAPSRTVALATCRDPDYGPLETPVSAPELPGGLVRSRPQAMLRELFQAWGLDATRTGTAAWNPLAELIPPGSSVVLKPNWVYHANKKPASGLDCMLTHTAVLSAVLDYACLARPGRLILGDAPLQSCDFAALTQACDVASLVEQAARHDCQLDIMDFRRTLLHRQNGEMRRTEDARNQGNYTLFDLGPESLLDALPAADRFRVTMYNPDLLQRTHAPGRHQYLIAREVLEANVVVNLPKLKTHMKAGVTGALKNLIGINGNKEFLPHHRRGGSEVGGDCYEGYSFWQHEAEQLFDAANRRNGGAASALYWIAEKCLSAARRTGHPGLVEGAWYGNETIWRTCLDLNRVLRYGRADGTLADSPQRRTIHITDAIIGGQGEGPLRPDPIRSGFLTGALNPAAAEWINVLLMGWDPRKVPVVREAFGEFRWPIADFSPKEIEVRALSGPLRLSEIGPPSGVSFRPSAGWRGQVEADAGVEVPA